MVSLLGPRPIDGAIMGVVALGAVLAREVLMPRINHHRDRKLAGEPEAERSFARLHRLSMWINGAQLLAGLVVLVRLGVV